MTAAARIHVPADHVHLGFAVRTGAPVAVPVQHLAVTGQTQASGKTTSLEALVARSGLRAVAFVTKRHEGSFRGEHHRIAPYFRERADWQSVAAILEATMRERMRFERSWIMRASKGAKTLADVHRNVHKLMEKAKGLSADVYLVLDHYLQIVVPQIERLDAQFGGEPLALMPGLNVMDLSSYTTELQSLVIRSVLEWVYAVGNDVLTIIPESWEFIPQARGSPVLLAAEQLIRKGGAGGNFVWLDSQDIAGVHKNVLRSVGVWLLGVQREANEVKRALAHIPGKKPTIDDVMQLERGQFYVCFGRTVVKVYVQPQWMDATTARRIAIGEIPIPSSPSMPPPAATPSASTLPTPTPPSPPTSVPTPTSTPSPSPSTMPTPPTTPSTTTPTSTPSPSRMEESTVKEEEANALRTENATLKGEVSRLQLELEELLAGTRVPTPNAPPADPPRAEPQSSFGDVDWLYACIKKRALEDSDPKMLALFAPAREIEVTRSVERIRVDFKTQPGFLAAMIVDGYFGKPMAGNAVVEELKRRGRSVHHANVYRDLNRLAEQGFLTKEGDGYQAVPGMKVNIIEA